MAATFKPIHFIIDDQSGNRSLTLKLTHNGNNRSPICGSRLKFEINCEHLIFILDGVPRVEAAVPVFHLRTPRQVRLCCFTHPDNIAAYFRGTAAIKNLLNLRNKLVHFKQPNRSIILERQS